MEQATQTRQLVPSYFTHLNRFSLDEAAAIKQTLANLGVRMLPYPFGSALAVLSDVDSSRRRRYQGYIGELVDDLGLDFGDSIWLTWHHFTMKRPSNIGERRVIANAFGFLTPWFTTGRQEPETWFANTHTFNETIAEFHKGNVDHLHAFLPQGMRVIPVTEFKADKLGRLVIEPGALQDEEPWTCSDVFVMAVCVVLSEGETANVRRVDVTPKDGHTTGAAYVQTPFEGPQDGRRHLLFTAQGDAESMLKPPLLVNTKSITIELDDPAQSPGVERVMLISAHAALLLDRMAWLRSHYNIEMSTITEHSRFHFRHESKAMKLDIELSEHLRDYQGPLEAYNGTYRDGAGRLIFSTTSDEPRSFGCVFPEITRDHEIRFINPIAAMSPLGWDPLEVVTPSSTRAGGGLYYAKRTMPNLTEPPPGKLFDGGSPRQDSFAKRVVYMLGQMADEPGRFWPMCTHLGGWDPAVKYENKGVVDALGAPVPVPYFDPDAMHLLQDHVFNISGQIPPSARVWFARGGGHYDYALIVRGVADHISRPNANTIEIESWRDEVLDKDLPRSTSQLYGLTFYVDDPAKAVVTVDGATIESLFRNPADETGRPSVTIADCDLRYILFDELNPTANPQSETTFEGVDWEWLAGEPNDRNSGRLTLTSAGRSSSRELCGSARIQLHGWAATGAQAMRFHLRGSARAAILLETQGGGRFLFGEGAPADFRQDSVTAHYAWSMKDRDPDQWRVVCVPFHDLTWAKDARPGGPMPNHPLKSISLIAAGGFDEWLDIAGVELMRPRAIRRTEPDAFCLGGRVVGFRGGEVVRLRPADAPDAPARETVVDQRGFFCFDRAPPGVYEVWMQAEGANPSYDRRGRLVELQADMLILELGGHAS